MDTTVKCNSRAQELEFLISIMQDLAHNYNNHNSNLLEELISNLKYRKEKEEITIKAKHKSEEYLRQKKNGKIKKNYHHKT